MDLNPKHETAWAVLVGAGLMILFGLVVGFIMLVRQ